MIEVEENLDPNVIIKANTVKLHHPDTSAKHTTSSGKPHAPLVSEPVDHSLPK